MSFFYNLFRKNADGSATATRAITFLADLITLADDIDITNDLGVGNDLDVTGAATIGETLGVTGNTTVGGTLGVTGATTVAALTATGALTLAGITLSANAGSPEATVTGNRKGDLCVDYTNGALYVFAGTASQNTGWKLVTQTA